MGKSTEPPTCRFCGKQHRGTCMDHEAKGAIHKQAERFTFGSGRIKPSTHLSAILGRQPRTPAQKDYANRLPPEKRSASSGGSSAVERRPSKPTVEGSTPSPRSKPTRGEKALSPASKGSRPRSAKAKAGSSVSSSTIIILDDPDGPPPTEEQREAFRRHFSKRLSTTITDGGVSHTAIHAPITAAELGVAPKKRKPRMTQPTDKPANSDPMNGPVTKPTRGRPKTIDDMKAYKAKKAREARAKKKASQP